MNISLLAGLPLSALAFVLRANPSRAAEAGGDGGATPPSGHYWSPSEPPGPSALLRKLFFGPHKQTWAIKSYTGDNKRVMESGGGGTERGGGPWRRANRANVTPAALPGKVLSADSGHEILHSAT